MFFQILLFSFLCHTVTPVTPSCHLCGRAGNADLNPRGVVKGRSCAYWVMTHYKQRNKTICQSLRSEFKACCDGSDLRRSPTVSPTKPPVWSIVKTGRNPICHLCIDGNFPRKPNNIINMLYIGQGSCKEYYIGGLRGDVPAFLCDPLRYFAGEPCGCGKTTPSRGIGLEGFDEEITVINAPILILLLVIGMFSATTLIVVAKAMQYFRRRPRPLRRT